MQTPQEVIDLIREAVERAYDAEDIKLETRMAIDDILDSVLDDIES